MPPAEHGAPPDPACPAPAARWRDRGARDRGSALFLLPALALALVVCLAVALDLTGAYLAHRQLQAAADAAANDAVTAGLDLAHFDATGQYVLDPGRTEAAVTRSLAANDAPVVHNATVAVTTAATADPDRPATVTVHLHAVAPTWFARAVPGGPASFTIDVTATATAAVEP